MKNYVKKTANIIVKNIAVYNAF